MNPNDIFANFVFFKSLILWNSSDLVRLGGMREHFYSFLFCVWWTYRPFLIYLEFNFCNHTSCFDNVCFFLLTMLLDMQLLTGFFADGPNGSLWLILVWPLEEFCRLEEDTLVCIHWEFISQSSCNTTWVWVICLFQSFESLLGSTWVRWKQQKAARMWTLEMSFESAINLYQVAFLRLLM